jgi:hypothetical protein
MVACMHGGWSGTRVAAAMAVLKDAGMGDQLIANLAGTSRATANRWARGANRPDHDSVQRLAARIWAKHPDVARELVEASGYPWREPSDEPEPLVDPQLVDALRKYAPAEAEEVIAELERKRAARLSAPHEAGEGRAAS